MRKYWKYCVRSNLIKKKKKTENHFLPFVGYRCIVPVVVFFIVENTFRSLDLSSDSFWECLFVLLIFFSPGSYDGWEGGSFPCIRVKKSHDSLPRFVSQVIIKMATTMRLWQKNKHLWGWHVIPGKYSKLSKFKEKLKSMERLSFFVIIVKAFFSWINCPKMCDFNFQNSL